MMRSMSTANDMDSQSSQADAQGGDEEPHRVRRVLVVDDESPLRVITARLLELLECDSAVAADLDEALAQLGTPGDDAGVVEAAFDMVILDATLTGSEVLYKMLQGDEAGLSIPVVLASGCVSQEIQERFPSHRDDLALQKPYGLEELRQILQRVAQLR